MPRALRSGRKQAFLFSGGGWRKPRPPSQDLDRATVRDLRPDRESPASLRVVQAQSPTLRAPHIRFPPCGMLHEHAALDAQRECAAVGRPLAAFPWLETMQLTAMPDQRRDAHQPRIIRLLLSSHGTVGQHPGIDTVGLPHLCQLLPRFLQTQLVSQGFRLVPPHGLDRSQLREFLVEPRLAHFKWGKASIPAAFVGPGAGFDVFHYKDAHREELAQQGRQAQFPLPARPGRRWQLLLALPAVLARLAPGRLAPSTGAAHARAAPFRFLDTSPCFCLDSGIGMNGTQHTVSLPLAPRINPHRNTLHDVRRWLDVEPDAKEPTFPEVSRLAAFYPPSGPGWSRRHEWIVFRIDHRDKDVRHV